MAAVVYGKVCRHAAELLFLGSCVASEAASSLARGQPQRLIGSCSVMQNAKSSGERKPANAACFACVHVLLVIPNSPCSFPHMQVLPSSQPHH
jgi:hypothetical protein